MQDELGWDLARAQRALEQLLKEGLVWVDEQGDETSYWVPSIFSSMVA